MKKFPLRLPSSDALSVKISYLARDCIHILCFGENDVLKLIKALAINKVYSHGISTTKIIKLCAHFIAQSLTLIF